MVKLGLFAFMTVVSFGFISYKTANSYFADIVISENNTFTTADEFSNDTNEPPIDQHVVINEIYYDPDDTHTVQGADAANSSEWIELYNPTSSTVNLKDWKISDNTNSEETVSPSNRDLAPGEFVVLAKAANVKTLWGLDSDKFIPLGEIFGNGLANAGDKIVLKDDLGNIVDSMSYGNDVGILNPSAPNVAKGHSLERNPVGEDNDLGIDFIDRNPPTPGS